MTQLPSPVSEPEESRQNRVELDTDHSDRKVLARAKPTEMQNQKLQCF